MCREPGLNHYGEIGIASSDHERLRSAPGAAAPSGRLAEVPSSTAQANEFFAIPVTVNRRPAALPPPRRPSRSVLSRPTRGSGRRLADAGFIDVQVQSVPASLR